jgi:gliding motility-associated-like protein
LVCEEFILDKSCQFNDFYHDLRWSFNVADSCDNDIKYVEIQYSPSGKEEDFKDLEERIAGNTFRHEGLSSYKGCYRIRSWDSSGNASLAFSEILCSDNCPNFQLPNAFSPNNDGHNDYFTSFDDEERCPRFVEEVHFKVFDRSGGVLYDSREVTRLGEQRSMSEVNWDGKTTQGKELEEGVYFYGAEVTFDVLNEDEKVKSYKGWVQLLR